VPYGQPLVIID